MSNQDHQTHLGTRNYLDSYNETPNLERYVELEVNEPVLSASREDVPHENHQDPDLEAVHESLKASSSSQEQQHHDDSTGEECQAEDTIGILRDLLTVERQRNKQRRHNYKTLQGYLNLLQTDYLRLAQELVDTLELSKKIKNEKDVCIATLESDLKDCKDQIKTLKTVTSDATNLRDNFNELLEKQIEIHKEQYEKQKQVLEQQILTERVNNSQLLQQFHTRLEEQEKSHQLKIDFYESRLRATEQDRDLLLAKPQNEIIWQLRDEKVKLLSRVDELEYANQEASSRYDTLRKKSDLLETEIKSIEYQNEEEHSKLQEAHQELSRAHQEALLELEAENEMIQVLQNNLNQSERRAINLLSAMKNKETTWENLFKQTEIKHEETLIKTKSQVRVLNKKISELEVQIEHKQNDLVRCQLEQENHLDSIRSDRDHRLERLQLEKNRLEQAVQSIDIKLTSELDRNMRLNEENSKLSKDMSELKEEKGKLSLDLMKIEALAEARLQELNSICSGSKNPLNQDAQHLTADLEEVQRLNERLEKRIKELKKDNQKLSLKLKVNESSLSNIASAIKKEQAKLIMEHEKKLESIKQQQVAYDKSQTKYKRYGFKLKKYCEHLSLVHKHLCNPLECGYQVVCNQDLKFRIKKS